MKKRRGPPLTIEEKKRLIKRVDDARNDGNEVSQVCKSLNVNPTTIQRWRKEVES